MSDAEYVRNRYGVPARRLGRIIFDGKPGTITGFDGGYLLARLDGERASGRPHRLHPTWRVEYVQRRTDDSAILDRLRSRTVVNEETGCWEWCGNTVRGGYGVTQVDSQHHYIHRLAWEMENGPIPDGMFACHKCDNPPCWNPAHIFIGTHAENMADRNAKGRQGINHNSTKTHCKHGHEFTEANTYVFKNGSRKCRRCRADAELRRKGRAA